MVMRWSLRFWPDTRPMVADVIGFAGSNHGTTMAAGGCSGGCVPANWQQGSDANFIKALNSRQETFAGVSYTEVYTHNDEVVTPNMDSNGSSSVHGPGQITNVAVQDVCPTDTSEHLLVGTVDPVAWALFLDAITHDGPANPARIDPSVCSQTLMPGVEPFGYLVDAGKAAADLALNEQTYPKVSAEPPLLCYVTASCASAPSSTARLKVLVKPRRVAAGKPVTLRVRVRAKLSGRLQPVSGATVRLGGKRRHTNSHGRARLRITLRPGIHVLRVSKSAFRPGRARVHAHR
jgi:hypothetical protein